MAGLKYLKEAAHMVKTAAERQKLTPKLSIQVSFDRSKPIVKIYDTTSFVELGEAELDALRDWLNQP
jgi:hypothetical protein